MAAVLIADDDALVRITLRMALQRRGHHVVEASDGEDLVARLAEHAFDLCIMDLDMPGPRVEQRLAALGASDPVPAVLILTGFDVFDSQEPDPEHRGLTDPDEQGRIPAVPKVIRRRKPIDLAGLDEALEELGIAASATESR